MYEYPRLTVSDSAMCSNLGEFGIVYKGILVGQCGDEVVAIKTLKGNTLIFF